MENRVWIIGSANYDTTYRLDHLPARGETILGRDIAGSPGGKGLNQAIAAARGGARVSFVGALGKDEAGEKLKAAMREFGVDVSHVATIDGAASGHAIINVDRNGDNTIVVFAGANNQVPVSEAANFRLGDIAVAQLEIPLDVARHYLRLARRLGATTVLNPSPATDLAAGLLPDVDVIVLNETETSQLSSVEVVDAGSALAGARGIIEQGVGIVVATLGGDGAVVVTRNKAFHVPGIRATVVDSQGAGDIFLGVFAARLLGGAMPEEAAAAANFYAGHAVRHHGSAYLSLLALANLTEPQTTKTNIIPL